MALSVYSQHLAQKHNMLPAVETTEPTDGGFVALLQQQPVIIAGIALGVVALVAAVVVGGVCYYKRSKRDRKARSLHGKKWI